MPAQPRLEGDLLLARCCRRFARPYRKYEAFRGARPHKKRTSTTLWHAEVDSVQNTVSCGAPFSSRMWT